MTQAVIPEIGPDGGHNMERLLSVALAVRLERRKR